MRMMLFPLIAVISMAGCGSADKGPIVAAAANTPSAQPSIAVAFAPLLAECQARFAQSLKGRAVTYGEPETSNVGQVTTIKLSATANDGSAGPVGYICTFDGPALVTAGRR
ncbi:MAG TPA: hypothetical protein VM689_26850 [Aliidongia sp.]|nr:hypothetical protein [Aliidongia sp.]